MKARQQGPTLHILSCLLVRDREIMPQNCCVPACTKKVYVEDGERDIEQSELKLLQRQEDTHRNKVRKFKLYYSSKFRVLRSTKISNTFLYNSKPRDVIKLGLPVADEISVHHLLCLFHNNEKSGPYSIISCIQKLRDIFILIKSRGH